MAQVRRPGVFDLPMHDCLDSRSVLVSDVVKLRQVVGTRLQGRNERTPLERHQAATGLEGGNNDLQ